MSAHYCTATRSDQRWWMQQQIWPQGTRRLDEEWSHRRKNPGCFWLSPPYHEGRGETALVQVPILVALRIWRGEGQITVHQQTQIENGHGENSTASHEGSHKCHSPTLSSEGSKDTFMWQVQRYNPDFVPFVKAIRPALGDAWCHVHYGSARSETDLMFREEFFEWRKSMSMVNDLLRDLWDNRQDGDWPVVVRSVLRTTFVAEGDASMLPSCRNLSFLLRGRGEKARQSVVWGANAGKSIGLENVPGQWRSDQ